MNDCVMKGKLKTLDLFAGIGGFSLGLERTGGFETVAFSEILPFPVKVLNKHWPDVPVYNDVRELTYERLRADGIFPDIITGGFPCQDISVAGSQKGIGEGTRSGLWSECARLLGDIRPKYAIFENVTALISGDNGRWFEQVLWDISQVGYDCEWHCIPASELGAHHHRDRVWIICYPRLPESQGRHKIETNHNRCREAGIPKRNQPSSPGGEPSVLAYSKKFFGDGRTNNTKNMPPSQGRGAEFRGSSCQGYLPNTNSPGLQGSEKPRVFREGREGWNELIARRFSGFPDISEVEPTVCRGANGVSNYAHRLKSLGNAIVPPIAELIGLAILENERWTNNEG